MMKTAKLQTIAMMTAGLVLASCTNTAGPAPEETVLPIADGSFHQHLRWENPPTADQFSAFATTPNGEYELAPQKPLAMFDSEEWYDWNGTDLFTVSFWAVRGEEHEINVELDTDDGTIKFLELEITEPSFRPDGSPIAWGDSVLITVTIDPNNLAVDLQPSGIQFGSTYPTELELSYKAAGLDLNADGTVNNIDHYIENNMLGVWMQEHPGDPWVFLPGEHNASAKEFEVYLEHFSGYAVSW